MTTEEVQRLVAESRKKQGLPARLEDPKIIATLTALLVAPAARESRSST